MSCTKTFEDVDIISVESDESLHLPSIVNELERASKIYTERQIIKRKNIPKIEPLYKRERQTLLKSIRPAIYKCVCYRPKLQKYIHRCRHFGNIQLNRDVLTTDEHINYLAQPKKCRCRQTHQRIRCYFVKRYLPNCTARIDSLAVPRTRRIEHTWKNYSQFLTVRQLNSLSKYLLTEKKNELCTDIERAIMLVREERYQKKIQRSKLRKESEKIKRNIIEKRKSQIKEIVWGIFEIMKDFLMNIHDVELEGEMKSLSNLILINIIQFASYKVPPDSNKEFLDKFLMNLAKNITIWMEKFTTNFGFAPLFKHEIPESSEQYPLNSEDQSKRLPIDDYIPFSDSTTGEEEEEESIDGCCNW